MGRASESLALQKIKAEMERSNYRWGWLVTVATSTARVAVAELDRERSFPVALERLSQGSDGFALCCMIGLLPNDS